MSKAPSAGTVVAGAGIGGLATALALHARGVPVTVLEGAPDVRPVGVGINIQPAAVAELTELGLGEALTATGIATREHRYLDRSGNTLWTEPRGIAAGYEAPQLSLHRGELQMALLNAVRDRLGEDAVHTGHRVRGFTQDEDRVRVHVQVHDGQDTTVEADTLVGADGLHSAVRAQLHPDEPPLRTTPVLMWRGLSELPDFLDGRTMIIASDERAHRIVAYPCSRRHDERGEVLLNWVALVATPDGEDHTEPGPASIAEVLPHFADWDFGWFDLRAGLAACTEVLRYPMVDRDPLDSWGEHRVTLLGDAAHPMYPIGANGATQAILDGTALAAELAADGGDPAAALRRYEAARLPATTAIVLAGRGMDRSERKLAGAHNDEMAAGLRAVTRDYRSAVEAP